MAKKNYYIDRNHPEKGIYKSWADCEKEKKKGGTSFIGFVTEAEAIEAQRAYTEGDLKPVKKSENGPKDGDLIDLPDTYAFVDGSYNIKTQVYGYGGFLVCNGEKHILQGNGNDKEAAVSRNVAGEVCGAMAAVRRAKELGIKELTIYYDYEGIRQWATKTWKRNKKLTQDYEAYISEATASGMEIHFIHVKGHSGIPGNEEADAIAKKAVGIE